MGNSKVRNLTKKFTKYYDGKDAVREKALKMARDISRRSSAIIRKLHNKDNCDLPKLMTEQEEVKKKFQALLATLKPFPELYYSNFISNYIQEYAEATIMLTLINNDLKISTLPDPDKLDMKFTTYLLGLADVIGELRRSTLDAIRDSELSRAEAYLGLMEQLYDFIINLNYTDGVLPLRRKQDVARALIEKTRSELAFVRSEYRLIENITGLNKELKRYGKNVRKN